MSEAIVCNAKLQGFVFLLCVNHVQKSKLQMFIREVEILM